MNWQDVQSLAERASSAGDQETQKALSLFADLLKVKHEAVAAHQQCVKVFDDIRLLCTERDLYSVGVLCDFARKSAEKVAFLCDAEGEGRMEQGILINQSRRVKELRDFVARGEVSK